MTADEAHAEALRRIRHAKDTDAEVLDLGDLPMAELPPEMGELKKLKVLALGRERPIVSEGGIEWESDDERPFQQFTSVEPLRGLTALTSLNLMGCGQLTTVEPLRRLRALNSLELILCRQLTTVEPLRGLSALTSLNLFRCEQLTTVEPLRGLSALASLNLMGCRQLTTVEPLRGLFALTSLDMHSIEQLSTLEPLQGLTALTSLKLINCRQLTTVEPLRGLSALTSLDLSDCDQLTTVEPLRGLHALTSLNLLGCGQLTTVEPLRGLTALTSLHLSSCEQLKTVEPLRGLTALTSLTLSQCGQLTTVEPLRGLRALTTLYLVGCKNLTIHDLEPLFRSLVELHLYEAECTDFPPELCGNQEENVLPAVRAYFADLGTDPQADAEVKVYLLGNGRVGKTKLARRLRGLDYGEAHETTTHGVRLYDHEVKIDDIPHPVRLNIWDFGGQDIYHASHSLFLRGPAVFLLLWCPEHENDKTDHENGIPLRNRRLPYWWDYLREHAGDDRVVNSPVLLIQSQCDGPRQERQPDTPLPSRDEFPKLQVLHVSAKTGHNLADVTADIGKAVRHLFQHHPRPKLGPGWVRVREEIRGMQSLPADIRVRTLSMADFEKLCQESGGVSNPAVLLKFLHETGVVFHRDDLFGGQIVVDQQWALDAIYTVCDRQRTAPYFFNDGKFTREHLASLVWGDFKPSEQRVFLDMMVSCGICFRGKSLPHGEHEYIAPDWLPGFESKRDVLQSKLDTPAAATATAEFRFLHEGIVRTFLAKIGDKAGDNAIYWKYGFWFRADGGEVLAQVTWDDPNGSSLAGQVSVTAWGPPAETLVSAVLETLQSAATGTKPTVTRSGQQDVEADEPTVITRRGVEALTTGGDPPPGTPPDKRVFISYSWGDTSEDGQEREATVLGLVRALESWGYEPLYDKEKMRPGDRISEYIKLAGRTAKVVAVLSDKYLKSAYCVTELYTAFLDCKFDKEAFLGRVVGVSVGDVAYSKPPARMALAKHWAERHAEYDGADFKYLPVEDFNEWKQMDLWAKTLPDMLKVLADTIHPKGLDAIAADGYAAVREMLEKP